jgi:hypothetical protein
VRKLRDAGIEEVLGEVLYMRSVPTSYKQGESRILLFGRQSPANKGVNTEAEEATVLEAVNRRPSVKIQQTEKT